MKKFLPSQSQAYGKGEFKRFFLSDGFNFSAGIEVVVYGWFGKNAYRQSDMILNAQAALDRPLQGGMNMESVVFDRGLVA